jgi:hypothetical protein
MPENANKQVGFFDFQDFIRLSLAAPDREKPDTRQSPNELPRDGSPVDVRYLY